VAKWQVTTKRFVAFFDIMGFKEFLFRNPHNRVLKAMRNVESLTTEIRSASDQLLSAKTPPAAPFTLRGTAVRPVLFSDSMLLVSNDSSVGAAEHMLLAATWLLCRCLEDGLPIKGAVAFGLQTADFGKSIHFGRPLVDAFELQDDLQLYAVAMHASMDAYIAKHRRSSLTNLDILVTMEIPTRSGLVTHRILDWTDPLNKKGRAEQRIQQFYNSVSGSTRRYVDNTLKCTRQLSGAAARATERARPNKQMEPTRR
jgi:hypothetical protein